MKAPHGHRSVPDLSFHGIWFGAFGVMHSAFQSRYYPLAFDSAWDGCSYVVFWAAVSSLCGVLLGALVQPLAARAGMRLWRSIVSVAPAAVAGAWFAALWLGLVRDDWPRSGRATVVAAGLGAIVSAVGALGALELWRRFPAHRGLESRLWMALVGLAVVSAGLAWWTQLGGVASEAGADPVPGRIEIRRGEFREPGSPLRLPEQTNVLLIVVDTLRADHLPVWGYARDTGPYSTGLAERGVVFTQTIAQATRTSPNMASLLTGTRVYTHGIIGARSELADEALTWGEILEEHGYRTVALVANPNVGERFRFTQGFQVVGEFFEKGQDRAEVLVGEAIRWLRFSREEPFFLWVHLIDPHTPYDPPRPFATMFVGDRIYSAGGASELPLTDSSHGGIHPSARLEGVRAARDYVARYDGEIRYAEEWLLRLDATLREFGLDRRTLVIFTSDHGESLGEHDYYFAHGSYVFEPTAHVPWILAHPSLPASRRVEALARTIDILPTVLDLLGLPVPPTVEGRSLVAAIEEGRPALSGTAASICSGRDQAMILAARSERWKLVFEPEDWPLLDRLTRVQRGLWPSRNGSVALRCKVYKRRLYDLITDPGEVSPLEAAGPQAETLERFLLSWVDGNPEWPRAVRPDDLSPALREQLRALGYVD